MRLELVKHEINFYSKNVKSKIIITVIIDKKFCEISDVFSPHY